MKKILLIGALIVGLCLSTVVGNCAWNDTDTTLAHGSTGSVRLETKTNVYFDPFLQPGEQLVVSWLIYNKGHCPLTVTVSLSGQYPFSGVRVRFLPGLSFQMQPYSQKTVALVANMSPIAPPSSQDQKFTVTVTFTSVQSQTRIQPIPPL